MMASVSGTQGPAAEASDDANEGEVAQLQAGEGVGVEELVGQGFTYQHNWGARNGQIRLTLNWGAITANSRVFVSISEGHVGAARYTLHNVVPENGRVTIWVNIEWGSPIQLYADYLIINP